MAAFPGPTKEQYKNMPVWQKVAYWVSIVVVFGVIAYVWFFK